MKVQNLLCEEIKRGLEGLKEIEVGSDEYRKTAEIVVKLTEKAIDLERTEAEIKEKAKNRRFEEEIKMKQYQDQVRNRQTDDDMKQKEFREKVLNREFDEFVKRDQLAQLESERKDRIIKNCISIAGIIIPVIVTIWGTKKSFEFEKEGTITTIMGRGFINKLLPKK